MDALTLYQFQLCPYCHKVRAGLELKGLAFDQIEVNPMSKKELPPLPEEAPKKVPVIKQNGTTVYDSTSILQWLDEAFPNTLSFTPADEAAKTKSDEIEQWVDDEFTYALPTVIYGKWNEAFIAAQVTARSSNFGFLQNISVRAGGSLIMNRVSKSILKKRGKTDAHAWVKSALEEFEGWLGDQTFVTGDTISMGDVAMHGAISCVEPFPIFSDIMARPTIRAWFERIQAMREANRAS